MYLWTEFKLRQTRRMVIFMQQFKERNKDLKISVKGMNLDFDTLSWECEEVYGKTAQLPVWDCMLVWRKSLNEFVGLVLFAAVSWSSFPCSFCLFTLPPPGCCQHLWVGKGQHAMGSLLCPGFWLTHATLPCSNIVISLLPKGAAGRACKWQEGTSGLK